MSKIVTGPLPPDVTITTWPKRKRSRDGKRTTLTWQTLERRYRANGAQVQAKEELAAIVFATVRESCTADTCDKAGRNGNPRTLQRHRCDKAVLENTSFAFEHDHHDGETPVSLDTVSAWCRSIGLAALVYETPSSTAATPRWRAVLPLTKSWTPPDTADANEAWKSDYKRLAAFVSEQIGATLDTTTCNRSRVFYPPTRPTADTPARKVEWIQGNALDLAATLATLPAPPPLPVPPPRNESEARHGGADVVSRARAYLDRCDPAISGSGGHRATFHAAQALVRGFELDDATALTLLEQDYNPRCQPPWERSDLAHKVTEARAKGHLTVGSLRDAAPPGKRQLVTADGEVLDDSRDNRPTIPITTDEHLVNNAAIRALTRDKSLWQREPGKLVTIVSIGSDPRRGERGLRISDETPVVREVESGTLRERMSAAALWTRYDSRTDTDLPAHVPDWAVSAVRQRGAWEGIPYLRGLAEYPVMREDGTVLARSGYDPITGLYLTNVPQVQVPERPTLDDARKAADTLLDLVRDFPIRDVASFSAWLAALLTPLARPAIDGPTPAFVINANLRGAGKSLLANLIGFILTGRELPAQTYPDERRQDELEKALVSFAMSAIPVLNFDNVADTFGCATLDKWLTTTTPSGRLLGRNDAPSFRWQTVVLATINNASIKADTDRRSIYILLESQETAPESRTDFRYPNLREHVRTNRAAYLGAALTILRAYFVAGQPAVQSRAKGSYESWCRVVRDALVWVGLEDPERAPDDPDRPRDNDRSLLEQILRGWFEYAGHEYRSIKAAVKACGFERKAKDNQSGQASIDGVADDERYATLRAALSEIDSRNPEPRPQSIGKAFAKHQRRWLTVDGVDMRLVSSRNSNTKILEWSVETRTEGADPAAGFAGFAGFGSTPRVRSWQNTKGTMQFAKFEGGTGEETPLTPHTPQPDDTERWEL